MKYLLQSLGIHVMELAYGLLFLRSDTTTHKMTVGSKRLSLA
jgi:hypothetical protein